MLCCYWGLDDAFCRMPSLTTEWSLLLHTPQQTRPMLFNGANNPQTWPFPWGILMPSNVWFIWPSWDYPPIGISIGCHFCRAHKHDQQTDRPCYNVCSNRPHLAIASTHPKNHRNLTLPPLAQHEDPAPNKFGMATKVCTIFAPLKRFGILHSFATTGCWRFGKYTHRS